MSAIVFTSQSKPEKGLLMTYTYKAYLSPEEKEKILKELKTSFPYDLEEYIITMHVDIELKKYDTKNT